MYWLNRFRGDKSIWAKYNAIILGVIFGLASWNPYIGLAVAVGYLAGESMGWGEWIGGLIRNNGAEAVRRDGDKNKIQWIAEKFSKIDSTDYHVTALFIRGLYWWGLTFISLYWVLDPLLVTITILFLASWFPLSVLMAESDGLQWENAEKIYGLAQGVAIGTLFISLVLPPIT